MNNIESVLDFLKEYNILEVHDIIQAIKSPLTPEDHKRKFRILLKAYYRELAELN
jgi:hypothetical protein